MNEEEKEKEQSFKDALDDTLSGCLAFVILLMITPLSAIWQAIVMKKLYDWYLAVIPNAPELTVLNFMGLTLLVHLLLVPCMNFTNLVSEKDAKNPISVVLKSIGKSFFYPFAFLTFGWIYQMIFVR